MGLDLPDKHAVHAALREALALALAAMVAAAKDAAAGATHEENRAEGIKDMRSTEASYLARGQAMRAEALADALARVEADRPVPLGPDDPVRAGALVHVELGDEERALYLSAHGGGTVLELASVRVTVVTPPSPMGRALVGKHAGDDFALVVRGARREGVIVSVR